MFKKEECICGSISTSTEDGKVYYCSACHNAFSRCEKCNDKYKTNDDPPEPTHLCKTCQKL